jgi:hypothetical protein
MSVVVSMAVKGSTYRQYSFGVVEIPPRLLSKTLDLPGYLLKPNNKAFEGVTTYSDNMHSSN